MKIGLLGFGVVGRGFYELTLSRSDMKVGHVICLEDITLPGVNVTRNINDILSDPEVDTVVEAMGGLHPAWDFVKAAIEAGKNVVTSNKALVAAFYDELLPLVQEKGVLFRCTAAVGGGICWLSELERVRRCETVVKLGGIMNGTCNYILDNMTRNGLTYSDALKQAQALGYAEANPSTDVDGIDTWNKLLISCNVAWGVSLEQSQVPAAGIRNIKAIDIAAFAEHGRACRLVSTGEMENGVISAYVQPKLFPVTDLEANVPANFNLITFEGSSCGRMSLYGQGAGRYPTAYNVLQDCVDLTRGNGFYSICTGKVNVCNDGKLCFYVRGASDAWLDSVTADHWGEGVITSPVSVSEMHAWCAEHPDVFMASLA
ncbi:MAG: homoserine dehydrogenase [Oscillospiraceae bacterium]|nr:homoserine dehydrogenase [Oscillospiraceae bacterium]